MKITILVTVRADDWTELSQTITEDQEPFGLLADDDRPDRPIDRVKKEALIRTRRALAALLRRAEA